MKWKLHRAIARKIAKLTGLPEEPLVQGSISPDRLDGFDPRFDGVWRVTSRGRLRFSRMSHHKPSPGRVFGMLLLARRWLNAGDYANAAFWLGRALHYIQDACTGKGLLGLGHNKIEDKMGGLRIPWDALRSGLENVNPHPEAVKQMVRAVKRSNKPEEALRRAAYLSAKIAGSLVQPGDREEAAEEARRMRSNGRKSLIGALTATMATLVLLLSSALGLHAHLLPYAVFSFLSAIPLLLVPKHYYSKARLLEEWFNL